MANIRTYEVTIGKIFNGDQECTNPIVELSGGTDVAINCIDRDCGIYKVQVGPDDTNPCLKFLVTCEDCSDCPTQVIEKCFCDTRDDCTACQNCVDGFCEDLCPEEDCVDGLCVDCKTADDCDCNQDCGTTSGRCFCPPGSTLDTSSGCCHFCNDDNNCPDCFVCEVVNGIRTCIPKDCGNGHCNPADGTCVECLSSGDCTEPNTCCFAPNYTCECCTGYIFNPTTGECEEQPLCTYDSDCGACEICDAMGNCVPVVCPGNFACNPETGNCEAPCTEAERCLEWDCETASIDGGTNTPGLPALTFSIAYDDLGIIQMDSGVGQGAFRDYEITVTVNDTTVTGSWDVEGTAFGPSNQLKFKLSDPTNVQWNNVGFEIKFDDSNSARSASIVIYNENWLNPDPVSDDESYFEDLFTTPAVWQEDVNSQGTGATNTGGTLIPGHMKLCPCDPNTKITNWVWTTTTGNLTATLTKDSKGCGDVVVSGCGDGYFTITLDCGGKTTVVDNVTLCYDFSDAGCCDPTQDVNCQSGPGGDPCPTITELTGNIVISEFNYVNSTNGFGLFRAVFQPDSVGLSIADWIRISSAGCWNTTGDMSSAGTNVSFTPPTLMHLFHDIEFLGGDGCVQFGYTCDVKIDACTEVKAQACMSGCEAFEVTLIDEGSGVCKALPSMGNNSLVTYSWLASDGGTGTAQTYTLPDPNYTVTSLTVTAQLNLNGTVCEDSETKTFVTTESCCLFTPSYSCDGTGFQVSTGCPPDDLSFVFGGVGTVLIGGEVDAGTYDITATDTNTGVECTFNDFVVPQCYICNALDNCVPATTGNNSGPYTDDPDCGGLCGCNIEITVSQSCQGSRTFLNVSASGDTGSYTVDITNVNTGETVVSGQLLTDTGSFLTDALCPDTYNIVVTGENCNGSRSILIPPNGACFDCATEPLDLSNVSFSCETKQLQFTITAGRCSDTFNVNLTDPFGVDVPGAAATYPSAGTKFIAIPGTLVDGLYTLTVIDENGCIRTKQVLIACLSPTTCEIVADSTSIAFGASSPGLPTDVLYSFTLTNGGADYEVAVYKYDTFVSGSGIECTGTGGKALVVAPTTVSGATGNNAGTFVGAIPAGEFGCYSVEVVQVGDETCMGEDFAQILPNPTPPCQVVTPMTLVYNDATDELNISWEFANTSNDLTVRATVWDTATCTVGGSTVYSSTGHGEAGMTSFTIPQINANAQCVDVKIFDTNDISCEEDGTIQIPACTCTAVIDQVSYDDANERLAVAYTMTCVSDPVDITVKVEKMTAADCLTLDTLIENRTGVTNLVGVEVFNGVTDTDAEQYFKVTLEDTSLGATCRDTDCFTLPACDLCTSQFVEIPAVTAWTDLIDEDSNEYTITGDDFVEAESPSTVNDNFASNIESIVQGITDICGTASVSWALATGTTTDVVPGSCLGDNRDFGTTPLAEEVYFTGVEINGTDYNFGTPLVIFDDSLGVYAGNMKTVLEHIITSLELEGVRLDRVYWGNPSGGNITIQIRGIDGANTVKITWGLQSSQTETTMVAGCGGFTERSIEYADSVRITIDDSEVIFSSIDNGLLGSNNENRVFDNTGC